MECNVRPGNKLATMTELLPVHPSGQHSMFTLVLLHFMLLHMYTSLQFRGKYCTFFLPYICSIIITRYCEVNLRAGSLKTEEVSEDPGVLSRNIY